MQPLARFLSLVAIPCTAALACDSGEVGTFTDAGSRAPDAAAADANTETDSGMSWNSVDAAQDDGGMCPSAHVVAVRERPTLWWIVPNRRMTMQAWLVGGKAWTVSEMLEHLFLADGGVLNTLQSTMNIGALLFTREANTCGSGTEVLPGPDNANAIRMAFPAFVAQGFSGKACSESAVEQLIRTRLEPASGTTPTYVLWMMENECHKDCTGKYPVPPLWLDPVGNTISGDRALSDNMSVLMKYVEKTFVFTQDAIVPNEQAFSWDPDYLRKRDDELAKLGGTGHSYGHDLTAENMYEIRDAFRKELSQFVSCSVTLNGEVVAGEECSGEVSVDGKPQPCNDPDGWHMKDERTIELTGKACAGLKERPEAEIKADFPCGVVVLF